MQDASLVWNQIVGGLEGLASDSIRLIGEDRTFMEMWGWNCPAMNRHEFAAMIRGLSPEFKASFQSLWTMLILMRCKTCPLILSKSNLNRFRICRAGTHFMFT